jgi:hypothetical protein
MAKHQQPNNAEQRYYDSLTMKAGYPLLGILASYLIVRYGFKLAEQPSNPLYISLVVIGVLLVLVLLWVANRSGQKMNAE